MIPFVELLSREKVLVSDGAMGTELQKLGLEPGACPELLNTENPEIVYQVHQGYVDAGSDVILTNTFGANRGRLKLHSLEERVKEICGGAVKIARKAGGDNVLVAGSIGPCGEIISPLGTLSEEEAFEIFREPAHALNEGGVDLFVIETMMAPEEALIALKAVKSVSDKPVVVSMTFEKGSTGIRTMWGTDIPTAVNLFEEAGADVAGANCGKGFDEMEQINREFRKYSRLPLWLKANAGLPEWVNGKSVYNQNPEFIRGYVENMIAGGNCIIGGCCGSTPGHIKAIREIVNLYKSVNI